MDTVNFKCGHCGNLMGVGAEYLGQQVRCPHCQQVVVAPAAPASHEPTAADLPGVPALYQEETALLSPPPDDASIFAEDAPTDDLFDEPKPPPLDLMAPPQESTIPLEPRPGPPPPALDSTLAIPPQPDALSVTLAEPPPGAEMPDWMKTVTPPAPPSTNGSATDLPATDLPAPSPLQAPRRSSLGMLLFISLVFMPLVLYSVLVTIVAILAYSKSLQSGDRPDPREYLIDGEGDHPGAKKTKAVRRPLETDVQFATKPLPPKLSIKIGDTLTLGQLLIKAEGVERGEVQMRTAGFVKPDSIDTLILRLHLKNVSSDTTFYPMDCYFDKKWTVGPHNHGYPPLTVLMAGENLRFFGGPAVWNRAVVTRESNPERRNYLVGNHYNQALKPGEEMDTFICVDGNDPRWPQLAAYRGPLVWHVHIRRGLVHWKDHDYPTTAVFGVEFAANEIHKPD